MGAAIDSISAAICRIRAIPRRRRPEELFIVAREGGEAKQLTKTGVNVSGVAWRPDGRRLAFIANEFQRDEYTYPRADLWTVTLDGKTTRLTNDGYDHDSPAWSPDGRHDCRCGASRAERGDRREAELRRADRHLSTIAATGGAR